MDKLKQNLTNLLKEDNIEFDEILNVEILENYKSYHDYVGPDPGPPTLRQQNTGAYAEITYSNAKKQAEINKRMAENAKQRGWFGKLLFGKDVKESDLHPNEFTVTITNGRMIQYLLEKE